MDPIPLEVQLFNALKENAHFFGESLVPSESPLVAHRIVNLLIFIYRNARTVAFIFVRILFLE